MAVKRGLNAAKGLGALIPKGSHARKPENPADDDKNAEKTETDKTIKDAPEKETAKEPEKKTKKKPTKEPAKTAAQRVRKASEKDTPAEKSSARTKPVKKTSAGKTASSETAPGKAPGRRKALPAAQAEAPAEKEDTDSGAPIYLRISSVFPNKDQPRRAFDGEALSQLAKSIAEHGILQPLLVQKKGRNYEIIAGERRWRAAKLAGLKEVPAIIRNLSDQDRIEVTLIENIQREDLNAIEEAQAFKRLMDEFGLTQDEAAKRVSKSRSAVANTLRLLNLTEEVQQMVADGTLSAGHSRALLALEDPELQTEAARKIVSGNLSVRESERLVKMLSKPKTPKKRSASNEQLDAIYRELEERLTEKVGSKVQIVRSRGKKGKLVIEYYSQEDLERIMERIH